MRLLEHALVNEQALLLAGGSAFGRLLAARQGGQQAPQPRWAQRRPIALGCARSAALAVSPRGADHGAGGLAQRRALLGSVRAMARLRRVRVPSLADVERRPGGPRRYAGPVAHRRGADALARQTREQVPPALEYRGPLA